MADLWIFPHQLYREHPGLEAGCDRVVLIEDDLFFGDRRYPCAFHKQKLWLHRASMQRYAARLREGGHEVAYVDYDPERRAITAAHELGAEEIVVVDPTDFILRRRLERCGPRVRWLDNPNFLNRPEENAAYRAGKRRWFMSDFYKAQRRRLDLMMEGDEPEGGQWSFDHENRKKVPKKLLGEIPGWPEHEHDAIDRQAAAHVLERFAEHPGSLDRLIYPTDHEGAARWLARFVDERLERFGPYEDAIVEGEATLWHSVLTPMLNVGLLSPQQVVDAVAATPAPIASREGFLRQVIGWREFMRATYEDLGVAMRTTNHWGHHRAMPQSFYDGTTGLPPIDDAIRRILESGYCHHIERLMVLGGFMFLCEIEPDAIYRWFMELFVDAYDWVMVPNVYAMSQHADGGLITTKPYFSGSAYIRKMSHYGPGEWSEIWDGLYWRWIWKQRKALARNPRWAMMCRQVEKMDAAKRECHLERAAAFLKRLDEGR